MTTPTNRESDKFMLRLPDGMRDRIKSRADRNNRSMNAEIVAALEAAYPSIDRTQEVLREYVKLMAPNLAQEEQDAVFRNVLVVAYSAVVETLADIEDEKAEHSLPKRA